MARRHLLHLLLGLGLWLATTHPVLAAPNFVALDVYIDSGATPLAAYQIEITAGPGAVIAGVEGGVAGPFHEPPYYDPAALRGGRIVLAAFNTGGDLPHGRIRVATLHMREEGPAPAGLRGAADRRCGRRRPAHPKQGLHRTPERREAMKHRAAIATLAVLLPLGIALYSCASRKAASDRSRPRKAESRRPLPADRSPSPTRTDGSAASAPTAPGLTAGEAQNGGGRGNAPFAKSRPPRKRSCASAKRKVPTTRNVAGNPARLQRRGAVDHRPLRRRRAGRGGPQPLSVVARQGNGRRRRRPLAAEAHGCRRRRRRLHRHRSTSRSSTTTRTTEKIEAVYVFPLPQNAAVNEFVMTIGERRIRGIIREREEAERIYAEAKQQGYVASLLTAGAAQHLHPVGRQHRARQVDRHRPHLLQHPGATATAGTSSSSPWSSGRASTRRAAPTASARCRAADTALGADDRGPVPGAPTSAAATTSRWRSTSTRACRSRTSRARATPSRRRSSRRARRRVALSRLDSVPNKDFVLRYRVAGDQVKTAFLTHRDQRGGFFTLMLQPPDDLRSLPRAPMEMVFVLDCSGSMSGEPIAHRQERRRARPAPPRAGRHVPDHPLLQRRLAARPRARSPPRPTTSSAAWPTCAP